MGGLSITQLGTSSRVHRVRQTLTDKTTWAGTGQEQVGTEEATLDDALLQNLTNVTVYAWATGNAVNPTSGTSLNARIEISLDGGSSWNNGLNQSPRDSAGSSSNDVWPICPAHQVTGTVTGDIQARLSVQCSTGGSAAWDVVSAAIYMEVVEAA